MLLDNFNCKAIFFDLDDTLLDSRKSEFDAVCIFKENFDDFNSYDNMDFSSLWRKISEEYYNKYLKNELSFEQMRIERMKLLFSSFGKEISDSEAHNLFQTYVKFYEKCWTLFDDTIDVLNILKDKYKLGIITNGDSYQQRKKISTTGLEKFFDSIIISSEVGVAKPDSRIFELACNSYNFSTKDCMMVGDRYKPDIEGALNSGMNAIFINTRNEKQSYKYTINKLSELI